MAEASEQIKNYIIQARMQGISDQEIRSNLLAVGWHNDQINQGFSSVSGGSFWSKRPFKISVTVAAVVLLLCAAYFVYANYSPQAVLQGLLSQLDNPNSGADLGSRHTAFNLNVSDSSLGKASLGVSGDSTISGPKIEQSSFDVQLNAAAEFQAPGQPGKISFNADGLEAREASGRIYLNLAQIPYVKDSLAPYGGWVEIDLNKLPADQKKKIEDGLKGSAQSGNYKQLFQTFQQSKLVSYHLAGIQKVGGVYTYHYKLEINKDALVQAVSAQSGAYFAQKGQLAILDAIKIYLSNLNFRQSDLWVGITDKQIHKFDLEIAGPSLSGLAARASGSPQAPLLAGNFDFNLSYALSAAAPVPVSVPAKALDLSSYLTGAAQLPVLP